MSHLFPRSVVLCRAVALLIALAAGPLAAEQFQFQWPVPASIQVKAALAKKGNSSTAEYRVHLSAREHDEYLLEFRDFEFLALNGTDARAPKIRAQLGPLAALTGSLPATRISTTGEYLGTVGLEQMTERILGALPDGMDAQRRAQLDQYFRSPQVQAMMQQKAGDTWSTWVGAWNGLELSAGQTLRGSVPVKVMKRELQQSITVEHLGAADAAAGCAACVSLRMTTSIEGEEVLQLVAGIIREVSGKAGAETGQFVSARSITVTEIVTDPGTLMPRHAVSTTAVVLRDASNQEHSQHERKEYTFKWQ